MDSIKPGLLIRSAKNSATFATANKRDYREVLGVDRSAVIAWPNGVVTIETIADDGTLRRAVSGPPSEKSLF